MNIFTLVFWITDRNHKVKPLLVLTIFLWVGAILAAAISLGRPAWLWPLFLLIVVTVFRIFYYLLNWFARLIGHGIYRIQLAQKVRPVVTRVHRKKKPLRPEEPDNIPWHEVRKVVFGFYCLIAIGLAISWNFDVFYWTFIILGIAGTEAVVYMINICRKQPGFSIKQAFAFLAVWFIAGSIAALSYSKAASFMNLLQIVNACLTIYVRYRATTTRTQ